ncbi:AAA family ATPase [Brucellaceae bacterium D45D]
MLDTKLIMVFGISGVGKTTACAEYAKQHPNVLHSSASALLRLHRETAKTRTIEEIMQDQLLLVDLVRTLRADTRAQLMLLDAHSLISMADHEIIIPANIIASMKPNGMIFFRATGEVINSRRFSRGETSDTCPDELERSQTNALNATKCYSKFIPCRLLVVDANHGTDLADAIKDLS